MGIEGIFHANICVSDMERSLKFYRDILGFQVLHDFVIENEALNRALGVEKAQVRGVLIRLGDDEKATLLDLVQWLSPGPAGPPYRQLNNLGICRIALKVKGIEAVYKDIQAQGVEFMTPPQSVKIEGAPGETKFCCFYDPDRTILELIEGL